jgi:uncharacterized protein (UPF0333 family)
VTNQVCFFIEFPSIHGDITCFGRFAAINHAPASIQAYANNSAITWVNSENPHGAFGDNSTVTIVAGGLTFNPNTIGLLGGGACPPPRRPIRH